jgi:diacylglycerol kinase (ATP)
MQDITIIINPAARSERARHAWETIASLSTALLELTAAPGDARRMARRAAENGARIVVAAGGDGTINEVVNGIAGTSAALGVLPVGTMNVFASELGLPRDLEEAWEIIEAGYTRSIDLALANEQYFVQLAGVGIDALVVESTSSEFKRNFGPLSYVLNAAQIAAQKPPRLVIENDGRTREGSFVLIGNGRYYGMPLKVFKDARLDDGLLDVIVAKNQSHLDLIRYFTGVITGTHTQFPDVDYFQTKELSVTSVGRVPLEVDGELAGNLPAIFRIAPHKLNVVVDYS